jgi:hypothetical protein
MDYVEQETKFIPPCWILFLFCGIIIFGGACLSISLGCNTFDAACVHGMDIWEWVGLGSGLFLFGMALGWLFGIVRLKRQLKSESRMRTTTNVIDADDSGPYSKL